MFSEFVEQFQSNSFVKYGVMLVFLLMVWIFSGSMLTTLTVVVGMVLGRLSYSDRVDHIDV